MRISVRATRATIPTAMALAVLLVLATACADAPTSAAGQPGTEQPSGGSAEPDQGSGSGSGGAAMGMCLEGVPDCVDMVVNPDGEVPPGEPRVVSPRPGMEDVHPVPFDTVSVGGDGTTLTIDFWSGVEPCAVLDHVDVAYGDAVIVTLFEGAEPMDEPVACIEIAEMKRVVVALEEPLGERPIIDGAKPDEPEA